MSVSFNSREAKISTIAAAKTVRDDETGSTFILDAAEGVTVTLPPIAPGLNYKFIVGAAFATSNWVIASSEGDNITGNIIVAGAAVPAAAEDQINFVNSAETVGDFIELICDYDNSQWIVWGIGNASGGITATDPA